MSQDPVDRLIQELIGSGRVPRRAEIEQILERMASAPFNTAVVRVQVADRGASYQGQTLGARADSLTYHLTKRVVIERQWAEGTTAAQYLEDLRRAVRDPAARLAVYERRGDQVAATITPTRRVLPPRRLGPRPLPNLLVVYSAVRGIMVTGYQFSALENTGIPEGVRWLN